jgi:hypoxanthine phosphoribosyltransferase
VAAKPVTEFISAERIRKRVDELAERISKEFNPESELVVVCVLKGAFMFTADLVRRLTLSCRIEFLRASSYGEHRTSSGNVVIAHDIDIDGAQVLLVEDILDTGLTLSTVRKELLELGPGLLRICTLLDKPSARAVPCEADYTGFIIPDLFVVGYGLDLAEKYRELPFIGILNS